MIIELNKWIGNQNIFLGLNLFIIFEKEGKRLIEIDKQSNQNNKLIVKTYHKKI